MGYFQSPSQPFPGRKRLGDLEILLSQGVMCHKQLMMAEVLQQIKNQMTNYDFRRVSARQPLVLCTGRRLRLLLETSNCRNSTRIWLFISKLITNFVLRLPSDTTLKVKTLLSYLFLKFSCFSSDNVKFRFQVSLFYGGRLSFISHHFNGVTNFSET